MQTSFHNNCENENLKNHYSHSPKKLSQYKCPVLKFLFLAQNNVEKKMTNTKARKKKYTRIQGGILCKANETLHNDELWEYRAR